MEGVQLAEDPVRKLCSGGGLAVAFETVGTLHQCTYTEEGAEEHPNDDILQWEVIGHGIPVVMANENGVTLCLADMSGDKLCSFTISEVSQYTVFNEEFHIFTKPSGCFGLEFSNPSVAKKLFACLKRMVVSTRSVSGGEEDTTEQNEGIEPPPPKRPCEEEEDDDEDDDEVDFGEDEPDGIGGKKKKKKKKKSLEISGPQNFQHLSHVGTSASILEFSQVLSWKGTLGKKERITSQAISIPSSTKKESGTEESSSFEEAKAPPPAVVAAAAPPPPPPPAVAPPPPKIELKKKKDSSAANGSKTDAKSSLIDEIRKGVVLRPVNNDRSSCGSHESMKTYNSIQEELKNGFVLKTRSRTMTLPMPPKRREKDQLMFDINTFRRTKLRNISMTDFPARTALLVEENSLESILKKRLNAMFHKISDAGDFNNTGTVDSNGDDTFDGVLFSDN